MKTSNTLSIFILLITVLLFGAISSSSAQERFLGKIEFPVSCSKDVQKDFNTAVSLLHHMMYAQSKAEFEKVINKDPECSMAYWGVAMTLFHPMWAPPSKEELAEGQKALEKAKELKPGTDRENGYVDAAWAFYDDWPNKDHAARIAAWNAGQKQLVDSNPDDVDAKAFYALSLLATAPKKDKTFSNQKKAGLILEELLVSNPEHPGLFHYTIHAYDNPALAERAVPVARGYDKLAPEVPHALHMPSHIFVRLGIWDDTVDWNIRSAKAAKEQSQEVMSLHYLHAVDYLIYAYMQKGQYQKVTELIEIVNGIPEYQDSFASAYALASAEPRYQLERKNWKEAAKVTERPNPNFQWDKYPQYEAIIYYSRGLGAAMSGDVVAAKISKAKLDQLYENTVSNNEEYWSTVVDAQRQTVGAWIEYAEGNKAVGLNMMSAAADLEDSVDKHPVTPGAVMPAREMYAEMLIMSEQPAEALKAYEASLKISPNRFNSLYGAGYTAELSGDSKKAVKYYSELVKLTSQADTERAEVKHAKEYSAKN